MAFNPSAAEDMAGQDTITGNIRIRASRNPVTFTDSSGSVTIAAAPIGVNYIEGIGAPYTTSVAGTGTSAAIPASKLLTGIVVLASATSSYTSVIDSAANIVTAMAAASPSGVQAGDYLSCLIVNDSVSSCTVALGTGVTSANVVSSSIAGSTSRYCLFRVNNSTSVNMYF